MMKPLTPRAVDPGSWRLWLAEALALARRVWWHALLLVLVLAAPLLGLERRAAVARRREPRG